MEKNSLPKVSPEDYNDEYGHVRWRAGAEYDHGMYLGMNLSDEPGTARNVGYTVRWILQGIAWGLTRKAKAEAGWPLGDNTLETTAYLGVLREARQTIEDETHRNVRILRMRGASWSVIAAQLGITKQAAQQKYGK